MILVILVMIWNISCPNMPYGMMGRVTSATAVIVGGHLRHAAPYHCWCKVDLQTQRANSRFKR